jgi:hypothetical protein
LFTENSGTVLLVSLDGSVSAVLANVGFVRKRCTNVTNFHKFQNFGLYPTAQ